MNKYILLAVLIILSVVIDISFMNITNKNNTENGTANTIVNTTSPAK